MDDLWGPPSYYQAPEDDASFRFSYDVIEDTAINEKCCIQVLNILISKQDADISELEDELMKLLSQLACTDVEFSDMVSMSLRGHIDFLDSSVKKLKDGAGDLLSTSRPADSINNIMKALFSSYLRKKTHQFADKTRKVSSSYQVTAENPCEKNKRTSSSSNANQLGKSKRVIINTIPQSRVKTEEDDSIYPDSAQGPFRSSLEKTNKCLKKPSILMVKDILQKNTPNCNSICQKPFLETQGNLKMVKSQPDDESEGSLSICSVEPSQESAKKQKQNTTRDLVLFGGEFNPENHHPQQPNVSISAKKSSKRREIMTSKLMISSRSSPLLLEGPVKKYERNYYTVPELKAICKERKLTGYTKFRKVELAELLGIELIKGMCLSVDGTNCLYIYYYYLTKGRISLNLNAGKKPKREAD